MAPSLGTDVLCAMAETLATPQAVDTIRGAQALSLDVVRACIDYAESIERVPSIGELCLIAHVCERRLREAFNQEFGMAPTPFFRTWGLDKARRRLLRADDGAITVARVATDLGFRHLGRFARYYRQAYGVAPHQSLRKTHCERVVGDGLAG